jgi:hypothetical protein
MDYKARTWWVAQDQNTRGEEGATVSNSWPDGYRHTMSQRAHETWNASHYPGTRLLCIECDTPTGRCEDDALVGEEGPLCESCWLRKEAKRNERP